MPLSREVGLGASDIVLYGDLAPLPKKGAYPQFSAHVYCGQTAGCIKMPVGAKVGLGPDHIVLGYMGTHVTPSPKWGVQLPNFRPISIVAKRSPISATVVHLLHL